MTRGILIDLCQPSGLEWRGWDREPGVALRLPPANRWHPFGMRAVWSALKPEASQPLAGGRAQRDPRSSVVYDHATPVGSEMVCQPSGLEFIAPHQPDRGRRCAQAPANGWHPFGMKCVGVLVRGRG
jgi:hypothetical protein